MKKLFTTLALASTIATMSATPAMAEWIVAPPEGWEGGTLEGFLWSVEEEQRQRDRLVDTYAEDIKSTTPENSVERFNAVIKAVADYNKNIDMKDIFGNDLPIREAYKLNPAHAYAFRDSALGSDLMASFVGKLSGAVGLSTREVAGYAYGDTSAVTCVCDINGVTYWADAWMYDATNDDQWLASTNQLSFFVTDEQRQESAAQHRLENPNTDYVDEHGQTWSCMN